VQVTDAEPGMPKLSYENKDKDGNYVIAANMKWGTNATSYRFFQDGVAVGEGALVAASPAAQHAELTVTGAAKGSHVYVVEFRNPAGVTTSKPITVTVTKTAK
ncbi:MAG TPA: endo-1,4-beta-glycosidase, partial [Agromyces sp.]|nr:endo-1,4-beta-glycosidase [Agromyces sp.]